MNPMIEKLLTKAAQAPDATNAMHFAQAALSAAHALQVLQQAEREKSDIENK